MTRIWLLLVVLITCIPQYAYAQIELGGDARVNPEDFDITVFADGLNYPLGMAELEDGSILAAVSNGTTFFGSANGELIRLADTNGDGIADEETVLVESVPGGALTTVRTAGELVFTTGQGKPISIYRFADSPTSSLDYLGDITITYAGGWLHPHSTLAAQPTPGIENSIDLYFQLGSSENFAITTRTLELTSSIGVSATLVGDAIHRIRIADDGTTISASEVELIATGLRNATGLIFHPDTGDMYIAENGIDGLMDPNEPHSADELNLLVATDIGSSIQDFGFPSTFEAYRTQEQVGSAGIFPLVSFQPLPDPMTGSESEGPNDIALAPSSFPAGLNNGVFVTFHGKFFLGGIENEENPLVYVDLETFEYFHIISNELPDVGHLDGLLATEDALYISDISPQGGFGNGTANTGVIYRVAPVQVDNTNTESPETPVTSLLTNASVYPNPSRGRITIEFDTQPGIPSEVTIIDMLGRTIKTFSTLPNTQEQHLTWDGNNENGLPVGSGTYLLSIRQAHQSSTTLFSILN
ncbi:MAG: T9SS type A sorting domain-containing protein [Rhodothermaceae bacterium]|nr:T9SS type A sorting domain-containing protein [Rhodothermaceae bacterium]